MPESTRITIDPEISHEKPCIQGTRIPIYLILEMLEYGLSFDQIIEEYTQITIEDIKACLKFANTIIKVEEINPIVEFGISS